MQAKQKWWLIFWAGTAGFVLVCLAIATARSVASELPSALLLFPLALYLGFVIYLSGLDIGGRISAVKRLLLVLLSAVGAGAVIWVCTTVIQPAVDPGVPGDPRLRSDST